MWKAWKIGSLFGIGIYVHWTFLLLPAWVVWTRPEADQEMFGTFGILALIFSVFGCVVLHELGHALTARRFGIGTRDITIYPIGGVARMEKMSDKPWEEFWIAVGGPAVNVVIAGLLLIGSLWLLAAAPALLVQGGAAGAAYSPNTTWLGLNVPFLLLQSGKPTALAIYLFGLLGGNVMLVAFNMVPAFPMDGGRVFRALLATQLGQLQATRIAASVGVFIALVGGTALVLQTHSPWIVILAVFVLFAGQQELEYVEWRHRRKSDEPEPTPGIPENQPYYTIEAKSGLAQQSEGLAAAQPTCYCIDTMAPADAVVSGPGAEIASWPETKLTHYPELPS